MVLFRLKRKSMDFNHKIKLNGKQLYETNSVKYLGIRIDNKLNRKAHINDIALKLIRANAVLYKVRDFVDAGISKSIIMPYLSRIFIMHVGDGMCAQSIDFLYLKRKH